MKLSLEYFCLCEFISYLNIIILRMNMINKYCSMIKIIITLLKNNEDEEDDKDDIYLEDLSSMKNNWC